MTLVARLILISLCSAVATVFIAAAIAWGYVDEASRTGLVYHWLYSGISLAGPALGGGGWATMVAVYVLQYLVVFSLAALAWRAARRRSNPSLKRTPDGAA